MSVSGAAAARARVVVPIVVAVAWLVDGPVAAVGVGAVALLLAQGAVVTPRAVAVVDRALDAVGHAVGAVAMALVTLAVEAVAAVPWLLGRVTRYDPLDPGRTTARTAWLGVAPPEGEPADRRRGPRRAGSPEVRQRPGLRWRSPVRLLVVAALVVAVVVARPWDLQRRSAAAPASTPPPPPGAGAQHGVLAGVRLDLSVFRREPWALELFRQLDAVHYRPDSVLGVVPLDHASLDVHVTDGNRRTLAIAGRPDLVVWMFGGSTLFGIGQRDDHTIPSDLVRIAAAHGVRLDVVNFGVPGYVNWQETALLQQALTSGRPRPDLVVFYDGANETGLAYERMRAGDATGAGIDYLPASDDQRALLRRSIPHPVTVPPSDYERHRPTVGGIQYGRGVDVGRHLLAGYGIPGAWIWQPLLVTKRPTAVDRRLLARLGAGPALLPALHRAYEAMLQRSHAGSIDLTAALDRVTAPVYIDDSHTNELGAQVVAAAMYARLAPRLHPLHRR